MKMMQNTVILVVSLILGASIPPCVVGQEPQDLHPWYTECIYYGCPISSDNKFFCDHATDTCLSCPKNGNSVTEEDCMNLELSNSNSTEDCVSSCVRQQGGETCSDESFCQDGKFFCNYHNETLSSGVCEECKPNIFECRGDDGISNQFGVEDCFLCDVNVCIPLHFSVTTVEEETVLSNAMEGSPSLAASGPMVKCTNLIHEEETTCDDNVDVDGSVCLVETLLKNVLYVGVVEKCTQLGGVATIFYGDQTDGGTLNNETWKGSLSFNETVIPSVAIPYDDGKHFEENLLGTEAVVNVTDDGDYCLNTHFCSEDIPCLGTQDGMYCDYKFADRGLCRDCPEDPLHCFFSEGREVIAQKGVEDCARACTSSLSFPKCKLCPEDVDGFGFGVDSDAGRCDFCAENDLLYPDQDFPLFGENIKCWQVQKFFQTVEVSDNAPNCKLAQAGNYMCGCKGPGYAGASTEFKKKLMVWLPRVMALLSLLSSSFIIYDAAKSKKRRERLLYQLLIGLSAFDIIGSCAYMISSLSIPEDDIFRVFGSRGNNRTCAAQGFFIQVGTISAYLNVAVSIYYLLVIKYGWSDHQVKKLRWWLFLSPTAVGFAFAFAGIPFYSNMILWCNNSALYWPEIPVLVSILVATAAMGIVCWHVYQKEKLSKRWQGGAGAGADITGRTKLSTRVFWQSIWYLMAFYLTWPVYVALQYSWASGTGFTNYGFVLAAATMVPMQGFWNMLAYARPRYLQQTFNALSRSLASTFHFSASSKPSDGAGSSVSTPRSSEAASTKRTAPRSHDSKPRQSVGVGESVSIRQQENVVADEVGSSRFG